MGSAWGRCGDDGWMGEGVGIREGKREGCGDQLVGVGVGGR